jgi:hypothetical protein
MIRITNICSFQVEEINKIEKIEKSESIKGQN